MRLEVVLAVSLVASSAYALAISHSDLEEGIRTCDGRESCSNVREQQPDATVWMERNCLCDEKCAVYGDCCPDSPHFELQQQRRGAASFECVDLRQYGGIYMRTTCPPEWSEPYPGVNIREACETASENTLDPIAATPATDLHSYITYRNLFCAICHRAQDLDVWHPRVECHGLPSHISQHNVSELLYFNKERQDWGIDFGNKYYPCLVDPTPPNNTDKFVRRCIPNVIKTCAVNWTTADVRTRCEAYTSIVYLGDNVYRNPHCGICNVEKVNLLQCNRLSFRGKFDNHFSLSAFSVLFDLSGGPPGMTQPCDEDQLYDPFYKRCRRVLEELQTVISPRSSNFSNAENATAANYTPPILKCKKFLLYQEDYSIDDNVVYVSKYRKRFREGEFNIYEDGRLEICTDTIGVKLVEKFDPYMGYITFAGLGVSIIFLLLHLIAFCLVPDLRNLSGKNMASLCVALLIAYTSFVAGRLLHGDACLVVAVLTFYSFLASFTWMLTMSFDVWRTLRLATSELRVCSGKQWRKFIAYSLWSWIVPALIVMMALWAELSPGVGIDWRPGFASTSSCWFGRSKPLLIFFAVPLGIVMLLNIVFFASSAHMVYSSTSTTRYTASASTQRDFRLYLRLAVVMGLTWTMGLIAGTLDFDLLWYMFILLNTLQGLFIFLAFTCNDKVIRHLAISRGSKPPVIPRSFSWSTDSTIKKSQVESEKTMDTLY